MESLTPPRRLRPRGVALLEAMFAVAVFGLSAVALLAAVRDLGLLALESDREGFVASRMRTLLEEELRDPEITERTRASGPDERGVRYAVTIVRNRPVNREGIPLDDLFRILVRAEWREGTRVETREADALRYAPLYR